MSPLRKRIYALRNGLIADTLRKGGLTQKYIFGLQLPQLKELAAEFRPEADSEAAGMARTLWADRDCREARLLACHIMPPHEMPYEEAMTWASDAATREEADILAFRLLRHHPDARTIATALGSESHMAEALLRFLD